MIKYLKWLFSREKVILMNCKINHFDPNKDICYLFKNCSFPDKENIQVLELSLVSMTNKLNKLIAECTDKDLKPKQPSYKAIMQARGYLPKQYSNTLERSKK